MTRYTMPARSQGELYAQRAAARLEREDVHRWVFAHSLAPNVETRVRKWLSQRLDGFYCDLQEAYVAGPEPARTHIVLNNTHFSTSSMSRNDEAVEVNACGLNALGTVKALIKATGLNPHLSVCGWPFFLNDADNMEGNVAWRS